MTQATANSLKTPGLYRRLRARLRRFSWLRSNWYFLVALRNSMLDDSRQDRTTHGTEFISEDPYRVASDAGKARLDAILGMIRTIGQTFDRGFEIGCAEGHFTKLLHPYCGTLIAAELIDAALQRARERCAGLGGITFIQWDLRADPLPGKFPLVVIMSVLESFASRRGIARARQKLVDAVEPGGYLLVSNTRQPDWIENAWWSGWFLLGGLHQDRFFARHPRLVRVATRVEQTYLCSIFRKQDGDAPVVTSARDSRL